MTVTKDIIKALIIQYDNSIRLQKKMLDCSYAVALLSDISIHTKNQEDLESLLNEKINESKRLEKYLETARDRVHQLFIKQGENPCLKEFLDFAFLLSTFRDSNKDIDIESNSGGKNSFQCFGIPLNDKISQESNRNNIGNKHESNEVGMQFNEIVDDCESSKPPLNCSDEDIIFTLNSPLKISHESSNIEKLQRERIENEREKLDHLSENSSCLSQNYNKQICNLVEANVAKIKISDDGDHSNTKEKYDSDSFCMNSISQVDGYNSENNTYNEYHFNSSICYPTNFQDDNTTEKNINSISKLSTEHEQNSDLSDEISNLCYDICGRKYSNKYVLQSHIRQLNRKEKPYECTECGKRFERKSQMKQHILMHNPISQGETSNFCCNFCNRKFSNRGYLIKHLKQMHVENKPHKCIECGKGFAYNSLLKIHALVHGSQRPYKCSVCNADFKHQASKINHERIFHQGGAHFQCAHCDKRLNNKSNLISHIHTKHFSILRKQFMCTICNKSFAFKCRLQIHKLKHTSLRPLKCSVCDEYFNYHCNRNRHERKFHPEVFRFRCEHCDKRYWSKRNLIRHLQNNHVKWHDSN